VEFVDRELLVPAAERGTEVHQAIEARIHGQSIPYFLMDTSSDTIDGYLDSWSHWWNTSQHIFKDADLVTEERLYCDELKITGAIDLIAKLPDRTYIFDWKSSSRPQNHWRLQGAAYRYLCEVNGYASVDNVLFVHVKKGKKPSLKKYETYVEDLNVFKKCLELYQWFDMSSTRGNSI